MGALRSQRSETRQTIAQNEEIVISFNLVSLFCKTREMIKTIELHSNEKLVSIHRRSQKNRVIHRHGIFLTSSHTIMKDNENMLSLFELSAFL